MKKMKLLAAVFILTALIFTQCSTDINEEALRAKAVELHSKILTIDTHFDTPSRVLRGDFDLGKRHEPGKSGSGQVDFPRMKEGGLDGAFFAIFLGQGELTPAGYTLAKQRADQLIDAMEKACETHSDQAEIIVSPDDAYRLKKEGKTFVFLGIENGYALKEDISLVEYFYNRGIRYITLSHTRNNQICDSSTDPAGPHWNGLSPFGKQAAQEMNRLGIMIDVSHISDKSFFDVIELTKAPVIASHSSIRALCGSQRNLSDEMLYALKENGGVVQICVLSSYLIDIPPNPAFAAARDSLRNKYGDYNAIKDEKIREEYSQAYFAIREKYPSKQAAVSDLVDHIDHVVNTIGIDYVGIGTDFDGGGGIEGFNDVSEAHNVTIELLKRGYSKKDIEKIWSGNFMRVFREVIEKAKELQQV